MPLYDFRNPETGEIKEFFFGMNDEKIVIENGVQWERIFSLPSTSIDTKIDPFSEKAFMKSTENKKGNIGDIWDKSKELSEARIQKLGVDPLKEKTFSDYSKTRRGIEHPLQKKEKLQKNLKKMGLGLDV